METVITIIRSVHTNENICIIIIIKYPITVLTCNIQTKSLLVIIFFSYYPFSEITQHSDQNVFIRVFFSFSIFDKYRHASRPNGHWLFIMHVILRNGCLPNLQHSLGSFAMAHLNRCGAMCVQQLVQLHGNSKQHTQLCLTDWNKWQSTKINTSNVIIGPVLLGNNNWV